ncbi:hypothetical protein [Baekduia soli]|uniref:hypothetical protein n=1 Tax=Baekduia soli TaxID=496014 RepID=UPI00165215D9|nr:hypothetical protein [Baekduia soli]
MNVLPRTSEASATATRRRSALGGTAGNEALTLMMAGVLTLLLLAEGVTVLNVGGLLTPHMFIGLVLIPPLGVKVGSTGYRMVRYYAGAGAYREKGPPALPLRLIAPVLVAATIGIFASGVALLAVGHRSDLLMTVHKGSFIVWGALFAVHFLSYLPRLLAALAGGVRATRRETVPGSSLRAMLVAASLGAGVALALLLLPVITGWHGEHLG